MNFAIDREAFVKATLDGVGEPAAMNLPSSHWAYDPETAKLYHHDLDKARALLKEANVPEGFAIDLGGYTDQDSLRRQEIIIEQFAKAGRQDLVDKETAEIAVLEEYLPPAATAADIDAAVAEAIAETGAASVKDIGKVMKAVMPRLAGKNADGRAVNEAVRRKLGA